MNSVVLNAVSDCIFEPKVMGHPTYMIINPVLDFAVTLLRCAVSWYQFLQKSALHHSSRGNALGHILMHMSRVFMRYLLILRITCLCEDLEFAPCSAHCWTAYAMLGHVDFSKMLSWPRIRHHEVLWSGPSASLCSILLDSAGVPFCLVLSLNPNLVRICSISSGCESLKLPSLLCSTLTPRYSSTSPSYMISNFSAHSCMAVFMRSGSLLAIMLSSV